MSLPVKHWGRKQLEQAVFKTLPTTGLGCDMEKMLP
jgi:hypothetical protein